VPTLPCRPRLLNRNRRPSVFPYQPGIVTPSTAAKNGNEPRRMRNIRRGLTRSGGAPRVSGLIVLRTRPARTHLHPPAAHEHAAPGADHLNDPCFRSAEALAPARNEGSRADTNKRAAHAFRLCLSRAPRPRTQTPRHALRPETSCASNRIPPPPKNGQRRTGQTTETWTSPMALTSSQSPAQIWMNNHKRVNTE